MSASDIRTENTGMSAARTGSHGVGAGAAHTDAPSRTFRRALPVYVGVTAFVLVFGIIYEHFSFGVYSIYMQYAFVIPLVLGVLPSLIFAMMKHPPCLRTLGRRFWHDGIAVLTVGSLFTGVLHIYGTSSGWSYLYAVAGAALLALALLFHKPVCPGEAYSR